MRFDRPQHRETRLIKRFILWPIVVQNKTIWLESISVLQEYRITPKHADSGYKYYTYEWVDIELELIGE